MRPVFWIIGLLLLLIGGWVVFVSTREAAARSAAQQRWAQRPFERYSLQVVDQEPSRTTLYSYRPGGEITDPTKTRTVSDLFALLEQPRDLGSSCSPEPMTCPLTVTCQWEPSYHATLGYPERLVQRCYEHPNWLDLRLWRRPRALWDMCRDGACKRLIYEQTLEVDVTPLPDSGGQGSGVRGYEARRL